MKRLVLLFPDETTRAAFTGWFLDGGGEYQFNEVREMRGEPRLNPEPPEGQADWDWEVQGEGADEHVVRMEEHEDDGDLSSHAEEDDDPGQSGEPTDLG